jgi:hypothetical protein
VSSDLIGQAWISVNQSGLYLIGNILTFNSMAVDDMGYLKPDGLYFSNPLNLKVDSILIFFTIHLGCI